MARVSAKIALFLTLAVLSLGAVANGQIRIADRSRPTGLKPLDAVELKQIRNSWPRINKVHLNQRGLERINAHRTRLGKPALDAGSVRPLGRELDSVVTGSKLSIQAAPYDAALFDNLPPIVDNSQAAYFPPIGDQGLLNSCLSFATTYYQLSYMSAFFRTSHELVLYSPKWTYNMVNDGTDGGSSTYPSYNLLEKHGAASLTEFPYDANYLEWCLDPGAWRNAISARIQTMQYVYATGTDSGQGQIKALLNNGYVLVFGTPIMSWQGQIIMDDPATTDDDLEVGKGMGYFVNGTDGPHAMTIVGYNDAIWADVNGNMVVDSGEKGAFKVANSWGSEWQDSGFVWLAYDALRTVSAVPDGPAEGRLEAFTGNIAFVLTPKVDYAPSMIAEFTVYTADRSSLYMKQGYSSLSETTPDLDSEWLPGAINTQGGDYAFDGTTTPRNGTFVFDLTDLLTTAGARRYYLGMGDNGIGANLLSYKIVDLTTVPDTDTVCADVPKSALNQLVYAYVDYSFSGPVVNRAPVLMLSADPVIPSTGTTADSYFYYIWYYDQDGDAPATHLVYIDETPYELTLDTGYPASDGLYYLLHNGLSAGTHSYRFHFTDSHGLPASEPPAGTFTGPVVTLPHFVIAPAAPLGQLHPVRGSAYSYATSGSYCVLSHPVQYRFDWGDGTLSDWLPVGTTSATHAWASSGSYAIKAQARCSVETAIVSPWSGQLVVTVPRGLPYTESFASSGFPRGWIQQKIGLESYNAWILADSGNAGGQPFEMRCEFEDVSPGTSRLVTPPINTTGLTSLRLRFKHKLDAWVTGGAELVVQTSTNRSSWTNEAWSVTTTDTDIGPETVDVVLTNNLNSPTTYVAFTITGDLYMFDYWYIDDVEITYVTRPKVDFNSDWQEDILWRYYGPGGYNRAWFLGDSGEAAVLSAMASPKKLMGEASGLSSQERNIRTVRDNPTKMILGLKKSLNRGRNGIQSAAKLMTNWRGRMGIVDDPRRAWRGHLAASRAGVVDPRHIAPAVSGPGVLGAGEGPLPAPITLGGADVLPVDDMTWQIAGTGDFDHDTHTDILWRHNGGGGEVVIWLMNGTDGVGNAVLPPVADTGWQIVGTGDFNNDTHVDILWRYSGGTNLIWYMNGTEVIGSGELMGVSDPTWQIVGTGDFNKDGNLDVLWHYNGAGGFNVVWYLNNTVLLGSADLIPVADLSWQIVGTGDYNNDGSIDILWRYYGPIGHNYIWYMNGVAPIGGGAIVPVADLNWRIVSR